MLLGLVLVEKEKEREEEEKTKDGRAARAATDQPPLNGTIHAIDGRIKYLEIFVTWKRLPGRPVCRVKDVVLV